MATRVYANMVYWALIYLRDWMAGLVARVLRIATRCRMDRGIRSWMFVSIALVLAEVGRLLGGKMGWHLAEVALDTVAALLLIIMIVRYLIFRYHHR